MYHHDICTGNRFILLFVVWQRGEGERKKLVTISHVELVHELDPVQTEGVKEGTEGLHDQQHTNRGSRKHCKANDHGDDVARAVWQGERNQKAMRDSLSPSKTRK